MHDRAKYMKNNKQPVKFEAGRECLGINTYTQTT